MLVGHPQGAAPLQGRGPALRHGDAGAGPPAGAGGLGEGDAGLRGGAPARLQAVQRRRGRQADLAGDGAPFARRAEGLEDVAPAVLRHTHPPRRAVQVDGGGAVDPQGGAVVGQLDAVDEADALGVGGAHGEGQPAGAVGLAGEVSPAPGSPGLPDHVGAAFQVAGGREDARLDLKGAPPVGPGGGESEALLGAPGPGREEWGAVVGDEPGVERPAVEQGGDEAVRVDQGEGVEVGQAEGGPVAVRQVDVGDAEGARDKGDVVGVELALGPEGPDPVEVILDGAAVDQASGVEEDAGAQQLDRPGHLRRLGEAVQPGLQGDGVDEPARAGQAREDEAPREPPQPHPCHPTNAARQRGPRTGPLARLVFATKRSNDQGGIATIVPGPGH